jgi:trigger factor
LQVTITPLSEVEQQASIALTHEELQPHFAEAYERFRPKAEVRGFRKGKVPLDLIRKMYGEAIEHDALDHIADEVYRRAMEDNKVHPLGQPSMVDMDFKRGSHFRFTIKYEIRPEIALKPVAGIRIDRPVHAVTDEEVNTELLQIRRSNAGKTPADSVAGTEAIVTADVQEVDETGTPLIGKKSSNMTFQLYDESLAEEIRAALAHAERGGTYRATLERKDGEQARTMHIAMTVTDIQALELPAIDGALVTKLTGGRVTDPQEFKESVRKDIVRFWSEQSESHVRNALADEVVRLHEFPVPESLIEKFLDSFIEDIKSRSRGKALPPGFDEKAFRQEQRANAIWQARWMLIKERIAEAEGLDVNDAEIEQAAEADAGRIGLAKEKLLAYYKTSGSVRDRILSDKIMALLRERATVTDRPVAAHEPHVHSV